MFTTNIKIAEKYNYLEEKFTKAFAFLRRADLAELEIGKYPIDGDIVVANVQEYTTKEWKDCKYETHENYFDIQYVISGEEKFGYEKRDSLQVSVEYDAVKDITFYHDPKESGSVILREGDFIIVAPEDAHKPKPFVTEPSVVRKVVIKIRV
jgi:uncharacterized protein, YhcH/YjgK/YiaL family